ALRPRQDLLEALPRAGRHVDVEKAVGQGRIADPHEHDHAHAEMRRALDAVEAGTLEGDDDLLVDLTLEAVIAFRRHALDRGGVVAAMADTEADAAARPQRDVIRLEHHASVLATVEHPDLDGPGHGWQARGHHEAREDEGLPQSHVSSSAGTRCVATAGRR